METILEVQEVEKYCIHSERLYFWDVKRVHLDLSSTGLYNCRLDYDE